MPALELDNVSFSYDGSSAALDAVSVSIEAGEFVCILGGNGSGKSTLAKLANALLRPGSGTLRVFGRDTSDASCANEVRQLVGMVFQNPDDQIVASIVEDEVAFGPENLGLPPAQIRARVSGALESVGLAGLEKRAVASLSGGEKQRLAIAGALAMSPRILVLDEASSMLDPRGRAELAEICRSLNAAGMTIVAITHFADEAACATRAIVLDGGRVLLDGAPLEVLAEAGRMGSSPLEPPFALRMGEALRARGLPVGLHLDDGPLAAELADLLEPSAEKAVAAASPRKPSPGEHGGEAGCDALIAFEQVSFSYASADEGRSRLFGRRERALADCPQALSDVSFGLRRGEMLGVAGHTGSGKSTLIQLCNGLLRPTRGRVLFDGGDVDQRGRAMQLRREVGVVFQYPEHQLFAATVFDDVAFAPRNTGCSEAEVERCVTEALELVHLDAALVCGRSPFSLSGGQQRCVAIAGVLAMKPRVLVLDEPLAGLDAPTRKDFLALIREFRDRDGLTVLLASHDIDALAATCERILVLDEGHVFALGTPAEVFQDEAALHGVGLAMPHGHRLAWALGLPVPAGGDGLLELADRIAQRCRRLQGR